MESSKTQLEVLKERITFDQFVFKNVSTYEAVLNNLLEDSTFIGLSLRFPFDDTQTSLPDTAKYKNWQIRCCLELYASVGKGNIIQYAENGISWTRDSSVISKQLRNEIKAKVGIPKRIEEDE